MAGGDKLPVLKRFKVDKKCTAQLILPKTNSPDSKLKQVEIQIGILKPDDINLNPCVCIAKSDQKYILIEPPFNVIKSNNMMRIAKHSDAARGIRGLNITFTVDPDIVGDWSNALCRCGQTSVIDNSISCTEASRYLHIISGETHEELGKVDMLTIRQCFVNEILHTVVYRYTEKDYPEMFILSFVEDPRLLEPFGDCCTCIGDADALSLRSFCTTEVYCIKNPDKEKKEKMQKSVDDMRNSFIDKFFSLPRKTFKSFGDMVKNWGMFKVEDQKKCMKAVEEVVANLRDDDIKAVYSKPPATNAPQIQLSSYRLSKLGRCIQLSDTCPFWSESIQITNISNTKVLIDIHPPDNIPGVLVRVFPSTFHINERESCTVMIYMNLIDANEFSNSLISVQEPHTYFVHFFSAAKVPEDKKDKKDKKNAGPDDHSIDACPIVVPFNLDFIETEGPKGFNSVTIIRKPEDVAGIEESADRQRTKFSIDGVGDFFPVCFGASGDESEKQSKYMLKSTSPSYEYFKQEWAASRFLSTSSLWNPTHILPQKDENTGNIILNEFFPPQNLDNLLYKIIREKKGDIGDLELKLRICLDVAQAISVLHKANIAHGSVSLGTVVVNSFDLPRGNVTLEDNIAVLFSPFFNITKTRSDPGCFRSFVHIPFIAPELFAKSDSYDVTRPGFLNNPTKEGDIYSLGMLLYSLITLDIPFSQEAINTDDSMDVGRLIIKIITGGRILPVTDFKQNGISPSEDIDVLINKCISQDPKARPTIEEVIQALQLILSTQIAPSPEKMSKITPIMCEKNRRFEDAKVCEAFIPAESNPQKKQEQEEPMPDLIETTEESVEQKDDSDKGSSTTPVVKSAPLSPPPTAVVATVEKSIEKPRMESFISLKNVLTFGESFVLELNVHEGVEEEGKQPESKTIKLRMNRKGFTLARAFRLLSKFLKIQPLGEGDKVLFYHKETNINLEDENRKVTEFFINKTDDKSMLCLEVYIYRKQIPAECKPVPVSLGLYSYVNPLTKDYYDLGKFHPKNTTVSDILAVMKGFNVALAPPFISTRSLCPVDFNNREFPVCLDLSTPITSIPHSLDTDPERAVLISVPQTDIIHVTVTCRNRDDSEKTNVLTRALHYTHSVARFIEEIAEECMADSSGSAIIIPFRGDQQARLQDTVGSIASEHRDFRVQREKKLSLDFVYRPMSVLYFHLPNEPPVEIKCDTSMGIEHIKKVAVSQLISPDADPHEYAIVHEESALVIDSFVSDGISNHGTSYVLVKDIYVRSIIIRTDLLTDDTSNSIRFSMYSTQMFDLGKGPEPCVTYKQMDAAFHELYKNGPNMPPFVIFGEEDYVALVPDEYIRGNLLRVSEDQTLWVSVGNYIFKFRRGTSVENFKKSLVYRFGQRLPFDIMDQSGRILNDMTQLDMYNTQTLTLIQSVQQPPPPPPPSIQ